MARRGFLTAGCWCVDRNVTVPFWPGEDGLVRVVSQVQSGGGSGCNLALDIRRLDPAMPVATTGLIGVDEPGRFLKALAEDNGLDHRWLVQSPAAPTQTTDAYMFLASGRRTHVVFDGANNTVRPEDLRVEGSTAKIFHIGLPGIHAILDAPCGPYANGWVEVLVRARAEGMLTNFELVTIAPERIRSLVRPCLPHLSLLVVNDYEIGALADRVTITEGRADPAACIAAAEAVLALGDMQVVVVHYVGGASLVARDGTRLFKPSVRVPDGAVKGVNGAGDAFAAGLLYGIHEGWRYEDCLTLAHATAAACIRMPGTYDGVMTVAECLALAQNWGWR